MVFGKNLGKRTEAVKQALLTYIWDRQLTVGERLPTQAELCREFNAGCATIDRAVRTLVADEILESRRGIGVFVKNACPSGHPGRSVGLVGLIGDRLRLFNWSLAYYVQNRLQTKGCQCTSFPYRDIFYENPDLSYFPALEANLRRGALHGIITLSALSPEVWESLQISGIALCYVGPPVQVPCGVIIDTSAFIRQAFVELRTRGVKRPVMLLGPVPPPFAAEIRNVLAEEIGLFPEGSRNIDEIWLDGFGIPGGNAAAHFCLSQKLETRPDGVVCCDDVMAQGFYSEVVRCQLPCVNYLPPMIRLRNKQFDFDLPNADVTDYMVDINRLSCMAVDILLEALKGNAPTPGLVRYMPERSCSNELRKLKSDQPPDSSPDHAVSTQNLNPCTNDPIP